MSKIFRLFSIMLLSLFIAFTSKGQDLTNVKEEQLSDAQVKKLMNKAASVGFNDSQIEQMAVAQGMSPDEAAKLMKRVKELRSREAKDTIAGPQENLNRKDARTFVPYDNEQLKDSERTAVKIFGADLFRNSRISFEPNLNMPTPKGYIIGPGDELLIDLTGENIASYKLKVNPEGIINLEYVGKVSVSGLSIEEATSKIRNKMEGTYPGLKSNRTQLSVNLGNIRSIKITIIGEVTKPGSYTLPSLSTVFNALYASGGPNENGSFRKIEVIRNNKVITTIDIYNFLLKGIQQYNVRLEDQDVIRVPVYQTRVEITGNVKRPAFYETLPEEKLSDVLSFAGGFSMQAYTASVKAFQNTERERRIIDIPKSKFDSYVPKNGDQYIVESILNRFENRVEIRGAVFRPGYFELKPGLTVKMLIEEAQGLKEDAFMERGYIYRLKPDNSQELVPFNVSDIVNGRTPDISLNREDIVQISSIFDLQDQATLSIEGAVRNPGTFRYVSNMTVASLIETAGGFTEGASPDRIEIARRIKNNSTDLKSENAAQIFTVDVDSNLSITPSDFVLKPYDIVSVRFLPGYETQLQVKVEGEVLYPGTYTLQRKNETISDIIKRAGGLTEYAYPAGGSLRRNQNQSSTGKNSVSRDSTDTSLVKERLSTDSLALKLMPDDQLEKLYTSDQVGINLENILKNPHNNQDLIMQNGDVLQIPKMLQTVKVNGEVLRPNMVAYSKRGTFKYYINSAGGFTQRALKRGSFIQYANGSVAATKKVLFFNKYPTMKPGAEIWVPRKAARERLSPQFWIGIGSTIATLAILAISLLK
jgi:protein involved in polysaccharide export with SLBB domain